MSSISSIGSSSLSVSAANALATVSAAQPLAGPLSTLNLSQSQQQQITSILQNAKSQGLSPQQIAAQINNVLTPAQQQQLQSELSHGHHHHHRGGGKAAPATGDTDAFGIPNSIQSGSSAATQAIGNAATAFDLTQQQSDSQ
ncbi:MAG TPA: hypothetical protein VMF61_00570 [Candidatus Acidoferrales bacterium]|nr:hypothetical protein [Candidatus Acidoferrales bacterium]